MTDSDSEAHPSSSPTKTVKRPLSINPNLSPSPISNPAISITSPSKLTTQKRSMDSNSKSRTLGTVRALNESRFHARSECEDLSPTKKQMRLELHRVSPKSPQNIHQIMADEREQNMNMHETSVNQEEIIPYPIDTSKLRVQANPEGRKIVSILTNHVCPRTANLINILSANDALLHHAHVNIISKCTLYRLRHCRKDNCHDEFIDDNFMGFLQIVSYVFMKVVSTLTNRLMSCNSVL